MHSVFLNVKSGVPKYRQIIDSIEQSIVNGSLKKGDKLPSLNEIRKIYNISRDTAIIAFKELKSRGIINSVVGKGYYITSENVVIQQKVFLLFDELNSFKEDLYNSFLNYLGDHIQVDIFFHHFNPEIFKKLIEDNVGNYSFYVIMPANFKNSHQIIANLPKENVYILDQMQQELSAYAGVYQNFHQDIFKGLSEAAHLIKKYNTITLLFSEEKQPAGLLTGFTSFCNLHKISFKVIDSLKNTIPEKGELYIVFNDKNLIRIIKKIKEAKLVLAKNIGVISYNDTLLKEIVEGGITTISTNFNVMGAQLAKMILNKEQKSIENPSSLILRQSI